MTNPYLDLDGHPTDPRVAGWSLVFFLVLALAYSAVLLALAYLRARRTGSGKRERAPGSLLTGLAVLVAGRRRRHLRDAWSAHLAGDGSGGADSPTPRWRRRTAAGFVLAAVRMRLHDGLAPLWRPVDWLLATDSRTNALTTAAVASLAVYFQATEGLHMLLTEGWEPCAVLGGGLYALTRWLRRIRGVEPATRDQDPPGPPH